MAVSNSLKNNGFIGAIKSLYSGNSEEQCTKFYRQYGLFQVFSVSAAIITAGINRLLKVLLVRLSRAEGHSTFDEEQMSIISKVFFVTYVNMAVIVLIAYGTTKNVPSILEKYHVFTGAYSDFTSSWYGNVGFFLIVTFIFTSFGSLVTKFFFFYMYKPIAVYLAHNAIRY
jgi:hypothetical protein